MNVRIGRARRQNRECLEHEHESVNRLRRSLTKICAKKETPRRPIAGFGNLPKPVALFDSILPVNFAARTEGFDGPHCSGSPLCLVIPCFHTPPLPSRLPSLQLWTMHHRFPFDLDLKDLLPFRRCPSMLFSRLRPIFHTPHLFYSVVHYTLDLYHLTYVPAYLPVR